MFTNGLGARRMDLPGAEFRRAIARTADPNKVGMGTVLNLRGNVYGDERNVDPAVVADRRRRNKAARKARRAHRKAAR